MSERPKGELVIQTIAMPKDRNANGDICGGWVTSQMDLGSGILAAKTAQARVVTAAMEGMSFLEPVRVGDTVSCYARVEKIGRTSMTIPVEVWVTRHMTGEERRVTHGVFTLVAVDESGKPIPVRRRTDFLRLYQVIYVGLRLRTMEINHVHAHFAGMAARTAFWINKFFPITFSFTAHANDIFSPRQFEIGLDKLVDKARAIVTETDYAARFLRDQFSHRADRVHRIYNGLDLAEFGRADFSSTPPLIIAVGRLIPKKGFGDLIRTCALLVKRGKSFRCEIIGDGPLENQLRGQIDELCLQNNIELSGAKPQTQLRGRFARANVFVLPSVIDPDGGMDNLPTVIMEAMATGLPVVSTTIGGIPEKGI